MSAAVVLDLETKRSFQQTGGDKKKLGVSVVGIYDFNSQKFKTFLEDELAGLFPLLENASLVIGFNIKNFDLPVLAPYYPGDLMKLPVLDLLEDIESYLGFRVSLDNLAKATLGVRKTGHGLAAIEYYQSGKWDKLKKYCLADVRITRDLYQFGKKRGKIFFKDYSGKREIPVNWKKIDKIHHLPLTLPFQ